MSTQHTAENSDIDVSVIVVTLVDQAHLDHCLEALTKQQTTARFEVIIPADESLGDINAMIMRYRDWKFVRTHGTQSYAQLRSFGVNRASGRLVAITADHCIPEPDWVQRIVEAHAAEAVAIGGVVDKTPPDEAHNWALYFLDYLPFMPPVEAGVRRRLCDVNTSYKTHALRDIAAHWDCEFHAAAVNSALAANGGMLLLSPDIVVRQSRRLEIEQALWDRYAFGRLSGSARAANLPAAGRLLLAVTAPVLPLLILTRLAGLIVCRKRRAKEFIMALPALLLLSAAWAYGACVGQVTGRPHPRLEPQPEPEPWPDP